MAERRYGFRFSLPEGCVIVASTLLASFLIFLFGVYVGKEGDARKAAEQTRTVRLPVSISDESPSTRSQADTLSSPRTIAGEKPPASSPTTLVVPAPQSHPPFSPLSVTPGPQAAPVPSATAVPPAVEKKPAVTSRRWSVQVQATNQKEVADDLVKLLRAQGHAPLLSKVVRQGQVWYRVRVGAFANEEEAKAIVSRFRREGKFAQAYPVSEAE